MSLKVLLLCLIVPLLYGRNVIVNSSAILSPSQGIFPNLTAAFNALLDSSGYLIDLDNVITITSLGDLLPSGLSIVGPPQANLQIISNSSTALSSTLAACPQITSPVISSLSNFSIQNINSFSFDGFCLTFLLNSGVFQISNLSTVKFSNFYTRVLGATIDYGLNFTNITNVIFDTGVMWIDGIGAFTINGADQVTINSVNFTTSHYVGVPSVPGLNIINQNWYPTRLNITNGSISCGVNNVIMVLWARNLSSIDIDGLIVKDCNLNGSATLATNWVVNFDNVSSVSVRNVLFSNITLTETKTTQTFLFLTGSSNVKLSNVTINTTNQTGTSGNNNLITIRPTQGNASQRMNLTVVNLTVVNSVIHDSNPIIWYDVHDTKTIGVHNFTNITFNNCSFSSSSPFLLFSLSIRKQFASILTSTVVFLTNNLNVTNSNITDTSLYLLTTSNLRFNPSIELVHANFKNATLSNNNFAGSSLVSSQGHLLSFSGLSITNCSLVSSKLVLSSQYLGSIILMNSTFTTLNLSSSSSFVYSTMDAIRPFSIDESFNANMSIYAETRPFIVFNCLFFNITLDDTSLILYSQNPMAVIEGNNFTNLTAGASGLLNLGGYVNFVSSLTKYYSLEDQTTKSYVSSSSQFVPFGSAENMAFLESQEAQGVFNDSRASVFTFDEENAVYFISIRKNQFDDIYCPNASYFISFNDFSVSNGTINIFENNFSNFDMSSDSSISSSSSFYLFGGNNVARFILNNLDLSDFQAKGALLYMASTTIESLILDSNTLQRNSNFALYFVTASSCGSIVINNTLGQDLLLDNTLISISCGTVDSQITLANSNFSIINMTTLPGILETSNFIAITNQQKSLNDPGSSIITFQNNTLQDIILTKEEGLNKGIEDGSFLLIATTGCSAVLQDNTLKNITVTPDGSILTLTVQNLTISQSSFQEFSCWDPKGAVKLTFERLIMQDSTFDNNTIFTTKGPGLMIFTNPDNTIIIQMVSIINTTFSNNSAPSGTVLYAESTAIFLELIQVNLSSNTLTKSGGVIYLSNVSNSRISVTDSQFLVNQNAVAGYPSLKLIDIENTLSNCTVMMTACSLTIEGDIPGELLSFSSNQNINLVVDDLNYTFNSTAALASSTRFGLIVADDINASISNVTASSLTIETTPLITINSNNEDSDSHTWNVVVSDSSFSDLNLSQSLVVANLNNFWDRTVNQPSLQLISCLFSNITWNQPGSIVESMVTTKTSSASEIKSGFMLNVSGSNFSQLTGLNTSIYKGPELQFGSLILFEENSFDLISLQSITVISNSWDGTFVLVASDELASNSGSLDGSIPEMIDANYSVLQFSQNNFTNMKAESGSVINWVGKKIGTFILLESNNFTNITASQQGGIVSAYCYVIIINDSEISNDSPSDSPVAAAIELQIIDCVFQSVAAQNGAVLSLDGFTPIFAVKIEHCIFNKLSSTNSGGVIYIPQSALYLAPQSLNSSLLRRRILQSSQANASNCTNLSLLNNTFSDISAVNGAIIYEQTQDQTLILTFESNSLDSITATKRGGVFYFREPNFISIANNTFQNINATIAGTLIYSVAQDLNLNQSVSDSNSILIEGSSLISYAPTNLLIELFPISDLSPEAAIVADGLSVQNYTDLTSNPIIPNITSYSMKTYLMKLTLVSYQAPSTNAESIVLVPDESSDASLTLEFFIEENSDPKRYSTSNCTNSACTVLAPDISLEGLAGDSIRVTATYQSSLYTQVQEFYFILRECISGEINNTLIKNCVLCTNGTYSLNPNDAACLQCPAGANCDGGNKIFVDVGYYRSNLSSELLILPCNDSKETRCLGGYNNSCTEGFEGPACSQCNFEEGYLPSSLLECSRCPARGTAVTFMLLLLIATIAFQIVMVTVTYRANKKSSSKYLEPSVGTTMITPDAFLVIFITFTQIASVLSSFDLGYVISLLNVSGNFANPSKETLFSVQCLYYSDQPSPLGALKFEMVY